jgi:uracil phosphoribosyltransferase
MKTQLRMTRRTNHQLALTELDHPLVRHHLTRLRDVDTEPEEFRRLVGRLAVLLAAEATRDLDVKPKTIRTPLATVRGAAIAGRIGLIPILRAGLGMVDPVLELIPSAEVWHLGVYRDESTHRPVEYYNKLPATDPVDVALVLDPMLATGGSVIAALATLKEWQVPVVKILSIISARDGVREVHSHFPQVQIYTCAIDAKLNSRKFIVPGLGDAGDRQFNTTPRGDG